MQNSLGKKKKTVHGQSKTCSIAKLLLLSLIPTRASKILILYPQTRAVKEGARAVVCYSGMSEIPRDESLTKPRCFYGLRGKRRRYKMR